MNIFNPLVSGSLSVSGSGQVSGDLTVLGTLFATISGTAENAVSTSHASAYTLTSSFHQHTNSFNSFTSSYSTGSFTGSFGGDGAQLYNIPASGVTGLNLSQISQGSATASISQANGLLINTNTEITGNLKVNNINVGTNSLVSISVTDSGGKYFIDNVRNPQLTLVKGFTYRFLYANIGSHPFRFSTTNDGSHNGGTIYSTGVTTGATPNYIQIEVTDSTPSTLYYYCTAHPGMGSSISVVSDILNLEADRGVVYIDPARIATTGSNSLTGLQTISGSLSVTGSVDITGSMSLNGQPIGTGKLDETVFNTYTSSNDNKVSALETSSGSLNVFTSSIEQFTGSVNGKLNSLESSTSSLYSFTSSANSILSSLESASGSIRTDFNSYTSSNDSTNTTQNSRLSSLEGASGSIRTDFNSYTSSNATTNTTQNDKLSALETTSGSINSYTSSNIANINAIHIATSSLNTFSSSVLGAVEITGSNLTVKGNLLVKGTTTQIDSTTLNIGDNIIQLNGTAASNAGLVVQDASGASIISGSLLWDSATDNWKAGKLGSEERIILVNEYNTFSTSIDSRASSIQTATASLNSYTASNNTRLGVIETTTGSLNSFTSSTNSKLNSLESASSSIISDFNGYTSSNNSRLGVIESTTSSLNSYTSSNNSRLGIIESTTGSLNSFTSSANSRLNSLESASSSIRTDFNSYTSSNSTRLGTIESTTGSLNTFTSSANSKLNSLESASGSIRTDFNSYTSSTNSTINAIHTSTSSLNSYTSSNNTRLGTIESTTGSLNTYTSSANTRFNTIESTTASLNSFTNSINTTIKDRLNAENIISGSAQVTLSNTTGYSTFSSSLATTDAGQDNRLSSIEGKTGSYATTGSNIFIGNQTITGSLYISQDLIVAGSSSIQHISSSVVNIADNIITVNAQNPAVRFGGLAVIDSGSSPQVSGSLLFDATENEWIFVHQNQSSVTSALLIMGPETYNDIGNEIHLTNNRLVKSTIDEHVGDSNITDTGTKVSINSNTEITGTLAVTQNISSPNITAIQIATGSLNNFSSSVLTAIELTGSNLTVKGNLLVKGTTTNVNVTTLDVDNNLINLNGTGATNAGLRVKDTTGPNQVSGSLLWDASNDYWIAGQLGSEQRIVRETEFNNAVTRIGNVETSTGSLNSYTSSTNTRLGVIESTTSSLNTYTSSTNNRLGSIETSTGSLNTFTSSANSRLNSLESASGSIRTDFNSYTSSNNTTNSTQNTRLGLIETSTGSLNTFTSSASGRLSAIESTTASLNSYTSSNTTNINAIHTATASLNSYTSSNTTNINAIHTATSSLNSYTSSNTTAINAINTATSSLNTFTSSFNSAFSLSGADVTVRGNFTVSGTTTTVNSTTVNIADNIIQLNGTGATNAGLVVRDATASTLTSGSLLWDTSNDKWIAGPLGSEDDIVLRTASQTLTNKTINASQLVDGSVSNTKLANSSFNIGTTSISLGRASASQTLTGVSVDGNAGTVTNGVYTTGDQTIGGTKTFSANIINSATADWYMYGFGARGASSGAYGMGLASDIANRTLSMHIPNLAAYSNTGNTPKFGWYSNGSVELMTLQSATGNLVVTGTINGLTVSSGTISSGTWNGSSIGTAYTAAKVTAVNAGTGVGVDTTTGSVTVSIGQSVATTAAPTFDQVITSNNGNGTNFRIGDDVWIGDINAANTFRIQGVQNAANGYIVFGNGDTTALGRASTGALTYGGNVVYHAGNIPTWNQSTTGNAATATILATARNIGGVSFNGSANIDLPGVNTAGNQNTTGNAATATEVIRTVSAGSEANLLYSTIADNDFFRIRVGGASNSGFVEIATADDATEPIHVRQYSGTFSTLTRTATLLDASGNTSFPGTVTAPTFSGALSGNASTVTNGVYTTGDQTIGGNKTFSGNLLMSAGYISGYVGSTGSGDNFAPFRFSQDYSGWMVNVAGTPGSNNGWGLFWAGNSGAQYGTNGTGGPGNIWSNSTNPNEYVFVGNGSTNMAVHGNTGNVWIAGNLTVAGGTITATTFSGNATSATTADQIDSIGFRNTNTSGVNANTLDSNGTTYVTNVDGSSTNLTGNSTDGALYSQIYSSSWQHQIYGDYRTGIMYVRGKNNGTWASWKRVAMSNSTTFSNVSSVSFTHNLGTANLTAQVFDSSDNMFFPSEINITSTTVTVTFAANRTGRLVVTG
jgi:hypothetical protein